MILPFYLERKFYNVVDRQKVDALWNCFMPSDSYIFICKSEHFTTLKKISLKYQTAYEIITKFIEEGGLSQLKCFLKITCLVINLSIQHYFQNIFVEWTIKQ